MPKDVFCSDVIYDNVYFETKDFLLAYGKRPILPGHSLVIPKRHVEWVTEMSDSELVGLRETLKEVLPKLLAAFNADSYNFSINAGEHAGMAINHLHFHLVPRSAEDMEQGAIASFYARLQKERVRNIKDVSRQVARLRKIFNYKSHQKSL